jgi:hypothetical protein
LNFPVTVGLNYAGSVQQNLKIYAESAVGANYSMMTRLFAESSWGEEEIKFTPAVGFAFALEAGLFINERFSVGLRYNNLGSYKYKFKEDSNGDRENGRFKRALPIANISLVAGILF